jgi:hypothetical protein
MMQKEKLTIPTTRRGFLLGAAGAPCVLAAPPPAKPNILWITCEDMGPHLHACGDDYSVTPNLDKLCQRSSIYMNAWSNAPVCAPARTTIISGLYPTSTGSEHMRSMTVMPAGWKMFPGYLREAGYYCANNVKEDYNLEALIRLSDTGANGIYVATEALNAIDDLGKKAPLKDRVVALAKLEPKGPERVVPIIGRLHESILSNL